MNNSFYFIKCITNLHMGSGDINFSIVDNEVQRDPVTNYPSMFSSGVKGALREHFKKCNNGIVISLFGSDEESSNSGGKEKSTPGNLKFMTGNLLYLPIRAARGSMSYYLVTSKDILRQFGAMYRTITGNEIEEGFMSEVAKLDEKKAYAVKKENIKIENNNYPEPEAFAEPILSVLKKAADIDTEKLLIIPDEDLRNVNLPVLARNKLKEGISLHLWYEEVVPHEAVFYFSILSNGTNTGDNALINFDDEIAGASLVQFGGNATVGYGLTKLVKF